VRYAFGQCSLGIVLVAATGKGICSIQLGDDAAALERDVVRRFPAARLDVGDRALAKLTARVIDIIEAPVKALELPLDIRGTAFQQRVWRALRGVPAGATASYAEIARRIGRPRAVRAVAQACAANALAVAIPCHRILRTDGASSGYRWGIERQRAL